MPTKKGAKWSKYKVRRRSALRFLVSLYNKKKQESVAIFEEDKKELEGIQDVITNSRKTPSFSYGEVQKHEQNLYFVYLNKP